MQRIPAPVHQDAAVFQVAKIMRKSHLSCLAVGTGSDVVGVITEREVFWSIRMGFARSVGEIMHPCSIVVGGECPIEHAIQIMAQTPTPWLIVSEGKEPVGIVGFEHLIQVFADYIRRGSRLSLAYGGAGHVW